MKQKQMMHEYSWKEISLGLCTGPVPGSGVGVGLVRGLAGISLREGGVWTRVGGVGWGGEALAAGVGKTHLRETSGWGRGPWMVELGEAQSSASGAKREGGRSGRSGQREAVDWEGERCCRSRATRVHEMWEWRAVSRGWVGAGS